MWWELRYLPFMHIVAAYDLRSPPVALMLSVHLCKVYLLGAQDSLHTLKLEHMDHLARDYS